MALLDPLSAATGIPESSLRLLCTILAGFPIALLYRVSLDRPLATQTAPALRNTYFALTGLALSYFFNGNDIVHSLVTVLATYLSCALFANARKIAACLVWFINAAYLLGGYYFTATEEYDISWTMSQCVLCLRLMGFAMDYMDGADLPNPDPSDSSKPVVARDRKSKNPVSFDVDAPLKSLPPIWEFIGYTYFYGSFLIGPQFSFSLYKKFIEYRHLPTGCPEPSGRTRYAVRCLLLGVFYLAIQQVGQMFFETAYLTTPEFAARTLPMKLVIMWFTGKLALNKYLGVWTLNEAPCVLSGITFSGLDENRKGHWDGLCNIDLATFETATTLNHIVASFNMNTNHWLKNYVFKRLRFLNNKHISALVSLFFLAIWHGTHPGYFATFGLEFFDMEAERRLKKLVRPSIDRYLSSLKGIPAVLGQKLLTFSCFILTTSALHYAACQFDALRLPAMIAISNSVYWLGHLALLAIFVAYGIGTALFPEKRAAKKMEKIVNEIIHKKEL